MAYPKFLFFVFLMFSSVSWGQNYKPSDLKQIFQEHRDNAANFAIIYRSKQFNGVMKITEIKESDYNPRSNTAFHIRLENENKLRVSCYAKTKDEIKNISIFKVGQKVIVNGVMNRAYQPSLLSLDQCLFSDPKYDLEQYCKSNKVYENDILKSCFGVAKFQPCNGFHCDEIGKTTGIFERKDQGSDLSFGRTYISENRDGTVINIVIQDSKKNNERYVISYQDVRQEVGEERIQFFKERERVWLMDVRKGLSSEPSLNQKRRKISGEILGMEFRAKQTQSRLMIMDTPPLVWLTTVRQLPFNLSITTT